MTKTQIDSQITGKGYITKADMESYITGLGLVTNAAMQSYITGLGHVTNSVMQAYVKDTNFTQFGHINWVKYGGSDLITNKTTDAKIGSIYADAYTNSNFVELYMDVQVVNPTGSMSMISLCSVKYHPQHDLTIAGLLTHNYPVELKIGQTGACTLYLSSYATSSGMVSFYALYSY